MDVNQHERLSNIITLRHKFKQMNNAFIAVSADCYWQFRAYYLSTTDIIPYFTCMLQIVPGFACMLSVYLLLYGFLIISCPSSELCYPTVSIFYIYLALKKQRISTDPLYKRFVDSNVVIGSSKSKDRQYCDKTKTDHNHLQSTLLKTKD